MASAKPKRSLTRCWPFALAKCGARRFESGNTVKAAVRFRVRRLGARRDPYPVRAPNRRF